MALPKLNTARYKLMLPIMKKSVEYRPFLVGEEKLLLGALESKEDAAPEEIRSATIQIVDQCTFGAIDVEKLAIIDLEYLFLNIRAKAKGEISTLRYKCMRENEDTGTCNHINEFKVDVTKIEATHTEGHSATIMLEDDIGIEMRYPIYSMIDENNPFDLIYQSIKLIFHGEEVHDVVRDVEKEEVVEFIDSLNDEQMLRIKNFFDTSPKLAHDIEYTCASCGAEDSIHLEGLESFFE